MTVWFGFLAPKGTPNDVIVRLNSEMVRALKEPAFQAQLASMGVTPMPSSPDEFSTFLRDETVRWAKVVKDSGAKLD
jgi:tripartite-type tricarboxylate transporter receptor subunit TctC